MKKKKKNKNKASLSLFFIIIPFCILIMGFPDSSAGKESACNVGDLSSIPGLRRSPGEGKGSPLQYSGLENSMYSVHGVAKRLRDFHFTSLQANGGAVIPVELFKILKDVCMSANFPQDWRQFIFILILKKGSAKECTNYYTTVLILHVISLCSKPNSLQQYINQNFPDVQAGFRKDRGSRDQIANIRWIIEKAKEFQKNIYFCFIDYAKSFVWITTNCGEFLRRWEYQATLPASSETCMQVKKQ